MSKIIFSSIANLACIYLLMDTHESLFKIKLFFVGNKCKLVSRRNIYTRINTLRKLFELLHAKRHVFSVTEPQLHRTAVTIDDEWTNLHVPSLRLQLCFQKVE